MKKLIAFLFIISILAVASQAAVTIGADAGYLLDSEEEYLSARAGFTVRGTEACTHVLELEVGYSDTSEGSLQADLLPVTLNYRFNAAMSNRWGYTLGLGAGFARASIDGASVGGPVRFHDEALAWQGFAGVTYQATDVVSLHISAKYLWVDDVTFAGGNFEIGDDVALTAGISFKF